MAISIKAASTPEQLKEIEKLAVEIWEEHYIPIIGAAQVRYMLAKFQNYDAMLRQINEEDYLYFAINGDGALIGYFAVKPRNNKLFLSKLYIASSMRGLGIARQAVNFIINLAEDRQLGQIELTVNKYNKKSIAAYKKMGFIIVKEEVFDIGQGFVMDDYVMQLDLKNQPNQ